MRYTSTTCRPMEGHFVVRIIKFIIVCIVLFHSILQEGLADENVGQEEPNSDLVFEPGPTTTTMTNASAVAEAIEVKLRASVDTTQVAENDNVASKVATKLSMQADAAAMSSPDSAFEKSDETPVISSQKEEDMSILEMRSSSSSLILDAATMALALVLAAVVLPIALAYRVSASFRQAILALSQRSPTSTMAARLKKDLESDSNNKRTSGDVFHPQMLTFLGNLTSSNASSKQATAIGFKSLLSQSDLQMLLPYLPYHLTGKDWQLLFASELHGYSLHSAYRRASAMGPCVLVGMDMNRHIFACFCSESIKPNGANYFGNGECWVASISPRFQVFKWVPGNNEQFVLATDSFIGFGGGGTFALWLDAQFDRGTSEPNSTFGNATYLTSAESFKVASVEIWGFASPSLKSSLGSKAFKTVSSVVGKIASKKPFG